MKRRSPSEPSPDGSKSLSPKLSACVTNADKPLSLFLKWRVFQCQTPLAGFRNWSAALVRRDRAVAGHRDVDRAEVADVSPLSYTSEIVASTSAVPLFVSAVDAMLLVAYSPETEGKAIGSPPTIPPAPPLASENQAKSDSLAGKADAKQLRKRWGNLMHRRPHDDHDGMKVWLSRSETDDLLALVDDEIH